MELHPEVEDLAWFVGSKSKPEIPLKIIKYWIFLLVFSSILGLILVLDLKQSGVIAVYHMNQCKKRNTGIPGNQHMAKFGKSP